jgi:DNA gyrase/topoisomerase IV subunit A
VTMSITKMLVEWVKWRTELEKKACTYWIGEDDKAIRRLELLMLAVDNRKLIIESLDREGDRVELDTWLAKKLKISVDEAHFIYELRIFQLRKLERKSLEAQKKEVLAHKKGLEARRKKPEPHMAKQLDEFAKLVA